jgi:hypothetical protein
MSSVDFDPLNGVPNITKSTNVPDESAFAVIFDIQIVSYENFGATFVLSNSDPSTMLVAEFDVNGAYYVFTNGTNRDLWLDGYTGWATIAIRGSGAQFTAFHRRAGGAWTQVGPFAQTTGVPASWSVGVAPQAPASSEGRFRMRNFKLWAAARTSAELQNDSWTSKPRIWSNIRFWNPMLLSSSPNVDLSGTGGDAVLTGAPTSSAEDPGVKWQVFER